MCGRDFEGKIARSCCQGREKLGRTPFGKWRNHALPWEVSKSGLIGRVFGGSVFRIIVSNINDVFSVCPSTVLSTLCNSLLLLSILYR